MGAAENRPGPVWGNSEQIDSYGDLKVATDRHPRMFSATAFRPGPLTQD
jgi:hypothetical protein